MRFYSLALIALSLVVVAIANDEDDKDKNEFSGSISYGGEKDGDDKQGKPTQFDGSQNKEEEQDDEVQSDSSDDEQPRFRPPQRRRNGLGGPGGPGGPSRNRLVGGPRHLQNDGSLQSGGFNQRQVSGRFQNGRISLNQQGSQIGGEQQDQGRPRFGGRQNTRRRQDGSDFGVSGKQGEDQEEAEDEQNKEEEGPVKVSLDTV